MFDPVRSYDKPAVILTQLANGIATTDSVRRVLFDPAALSPIERESFVGKMKERLGGNPVSDLAIDVFTNPFVWLGMLTMGANGTAARNLAAGRRFFAGGQAGHWAGQVGSATFPLLRMLHFTSGATESIGKRTAPLAQVGATRMADTQQMLVKIMDGEVDSLLRRVEQIHGVKLKSLDPDDAPNPAVAKDLRLIRSANLIRRLGFDAPRSEKVVGEVIPERFYIRLVGELNEKGKRKIKFLEVPEAEFFEVKRLKRQGDYRTLDVTKDEDVDLLRRLPGRRAEDKNLYGTLMREKRTQISVKMGLGRKRVDPNRPTEHGSVDSYSVLEGGPRVQFEGRNRPTYIRDIGSLEEVERKFGLKSFQAAESRLYEQGRVLLAGDEAAYAAGRGFVIDEKKVLRLARSQIKSLQNSGYLNRSGNFEVGGEEAVRAMLGDEVAERLMAARRRSRGSNFKMGASAEELEKIVVDTLTVGFEDPYYLPRNTLEARDKNGSRIAFNPYTNKLDNSGKEPINPTSRSMMRTRTNEVPWDPGDLQFISDNFGGTAELDQLIEIQKQRILTSIDEQGFYRTMRVAPDVAADKYITSVSRDYAFFAHDAESDPMVRVTMKDYGPNVTDVRLPGPTGRSKEGAPAGTRDLSGVAPEQRPAGGYSLYDLIDTDIEVEARADPKDKYYPELWRKHILPAIAGIRPVDGAAHVAAAGLIKRQTQALADSKFMRKVEAKGGYAGKFVTDMRRWATDSTDLEFSPFQSITRQLYASHMGLNVGTVLINLLQPLQSVHQLGFKNTVEAYAQSLNMIGGYLAERSRLGMGATQGQIQAAMEKHFRRKFGNVELDMTRIGDIGSTWSMIEKAGYGSSASIGKPKFSLLETMMKPFQLSETLNRTVTANAVLNAYQKAGRMVGDDIVRAQMDAANAVQQFQFGTNPINRPALFYAPVLREPLFRQFAQYGLRSFANMATVPAMMGGTRTFAGREVSGKLGTTLIDVSRMMAVSAVAYEMFKSTLGADVSRGLALGFTDLVGGQEALQGDEPQLYRPPVVDLGWQALKYVGTGDSEILGDLIPRVLPGGVAVSRLLGTAGPSETLQAVGLQRTYADWRQAESGMVPVYKADGRFMGQFPTSDVVLRSFGADLGRFSQPQELSQFLLKNRDAIREGRRQYIAAVLGNNMSAASKIKVSFEKRFGLPLTVTQEQMKQAIKLREESVVGRTLESIDKTARDVYQQAVAESLPGQLMAGGVPGRPAEQGDMYRWGNR